MEAPTVDRLPPHLVFVRRILRDRLCSEMEKRRTNATIVSGLARVSRSSVFAVLGMKQSIGLDKLDRVAGVLDLPAYRLLEAHRDTRPSAQCARGCSPSATRQLVIALRGWLAGGPFGEGRYPLEQDALDDEDVLDDEDGLDDEDALDDEDILDEDPSRAALDAFDAEAPKEWENPSPYIKYVKIWRNKDGSRPDQGSRQRQLVAAVARARLWAVSVADAISYVWARRKRRASRNAAWSRHVNGAFKHYFGNTHISRAGLRTVRRRIRRIKKYFDRGLKFVVIQHQAGFRSYHCMETESMQNNAYTLAPRIYLCPNFWGRGEIAQARIIIHELVHRLIQPWALTATAFTTAAVPLTALMIGLAFGHPIVKGKRVSSTAQHRGRALVLADRRHLAARRSPVNYAWLYYMIGEGRKEP